MKSKPGTKLLFVINPVSGPADNPWQDIISNYFTGKSFTVDFYSLEKKPDVEKLKKYISETNPAKVIAVGGDGTVNLTASVIAGSDAALGILPAGSANGMAKELNIPEDPSQALSIIESGDIKKCDAIRINNKETCLHLSDIGINAQLIKYFDEGKLRGIAGYAGVVLKTLWRKRRMHLLIADKNSFIERDALMVVFANASKYGTGAVINPEGKIDDGVFEVLIVKKLALSYIFKVFFKFTRFNPDHAEVFHTKNVKIKAHKPMHFQIDGEYNGKVAEVEASILPAYVNIILPAQQNSNPD